MAYKPPSQTVIDDEVSQIPSSEAVFEALKLKQDTISPGDADKVLASDGSSLTWQYAGLGAGSLGTSNVILGRSKPASLAGNNIVVVGVSAGNSLTSAVSSNFIGALSGATITTQSYNNFFGQQAGRYATVTNSVFMGHAAGRGASAGFSGNTNVGIGHQVLFNATNVSNATLVGAFAGTDLTTGYGNTVIGAYAGTKITTHSNQVLIGVSAAQYLTGNNTTAIGYEAGMGVDGSSTGTNNTFVGIQAGKAITTGELNTVVGSAASPLITTGSRNIVVGSNAGYLITTGSENCFIGDLAAERSTTASSLTAIGKSAGRFATGTGFTFVGAEAGEGVEDQSTGNNNSAFGFRALEKFTTGASNLAVGGNAGNSVSTGGQNVLLGYLAGLSQTTAGNCVKIGVQAGQVGNSSSVFAIGAQAALFSTGSNTMALGTQAIRGSSGATTGGNNCGIGLQAGYVLTSGAENVLIGNFAGDLLQSGSKNIFIGYTAGDEIVTGSNNLILGDISGSSDLSNTMIFAAGTAERFRVDSSGNMGIGTSNPTEKLEVSGAVKSDKFVVTNYRLDPHTYDEGTETSDFTINWSNGAVHTVTLNAAGPLVITMSNPVNGGAYAIRIIQGATPGTVTWPANVKWPSGTPPTLSTATGDVDIVNFLYFDDGGGNTYYYGTYAIDLS